MADLAQLFGIQANLLNQTPAEFSRFLRDRIGWHDRLVGIVGPRGTGKTTLLLQHLAKQDLSRQHHLYLSADHIHVQAEGLYETAVQFFRLGGQSIIIDEVHKYRKWAQELKNLYDSYPKAQILFSGSSALSLHAGKTDFSRRVVYYELPGLSFREYLQFASVGTYRPLSLTELLKDHGRIATEILKVGPILGHFASYLNHGVYPFFLEGIDTYHHKLRNVLEKVLYEDIPAVTHVRPGNIPTLKRILWLIATSQPFTPNIDRMSRDLRLSKEYVYTYLDALERAGLIAGFHSSQGGYRLVRKPAKIYIENTNLLHAIGGELRSLDFKGTIRESFFAHQLRHAGHAVSIPKHGDFVVDSDHAFEIGGKRKGKKQLQQRRDAYVVRDDVEIGAGQILPLWLFGFLY